MALDLMGAGGTFNLKKTGGLLSQAARTKPKE
jgi:hypothetical protein